MGFELRRRRLWGLLLRRCGLRGLGHLHGLCRGLTLRGRLGAEFLREPLDASLSVDQLLTSREKGMAGRADFEVQLGFGRAGLERVATRTANLDLLVLRVNPFFHWRLLRGWCKQKLYTTGAVRHLDYPVLLDGQHWIGHELGHNRGAQVALIVAAVFRRSPRARRLQRGDQRALPGRKCHADANRGAVLQLLIE